MGWDGSTKGIARTACRMGDGVRRRAMAFWVRSRMRLGRVLRDARGQGTTEYAILVGVLVVIAIIAIGMFKPKIQELWTAIAEGINGL